MEERFDDRYNRWSSFLSPTRIFAHTKKHEQFFCNFRRFLVFHHHKPSFPEVEKTILFTKISVLNKRLRR